MSLRAVHLRFGHGAARLPLGIPSDTQTLSQAARSRAPGERRFAAAPPLVCVAALLLIATGTALVDAPTDPTDPRDATRIEIWEELAHPFPSPRPATPASEEMAEAASPAPPTVRPTSTPSSPAADPDPASSPAPSFDPRALVLPLASTVPARTPPTPRAERVAPRPTARPGHAPSSERVDPARLAVRAAPAATAAASIPGTPSPLGDLAALPTRPEADGDEGPADGGPVWRGDDERKRFIARLQSGDGSPGGSAPTSRPPVAAAASLERELGRRVRQNVEQTAWAAGWHEVPLDELPDCSPPGRQDGLKRQILRAAEGVPECSGRSGRFRFLETRNLNAFLMWSRSPSAAGTDGRPARNACEVLERALLCLGKANPIHQGVPSP